MANGESPLGHFTLWLRDKRKGKVGRKVRKKQVISQNPLSFKNMRQLVFFLTAWLFNMFTPAAARSIHSRIIVSLSHLTKVWVLPGLQGVCLLLEVQLES